MQMQRKHICIYHIKTNVHILKPEGYVMIM